MTEKTIKIMRVTHLQGPNIWTYRPVIEAWLDIGAFEQAPSHTLPGFTDRLLAWLPGLGTHRCGVGEPGGFVQRLREGTWIGHVLEHVVLELQSRAGMRTGFGKTRQIREDSGLYKMVFRTRNEAVGRAALESGRALVLAAVEDRPFDLTASLASLTAMVDDLCLGPSTACIVDAAAGRGIPFIRLTDGNLVQLGHGRRQRRIWTAETDRTSAIAEYISSDKDLTKRLLASCGVPVPEGQIVASAGEAWEAAQEIGLPVVIKPVDANHGRGVSLDLLRQKDIEDAFAVAQGHGSAVLVERFVRGHEHRLLVVGGQMAAAVKGEFAQVRGDGQSTLRALVDQQLNSDPRRGLGEDFPLNRIDIERDGAVQLELQRQGFGPDAVPAQGQQVLIQRNGNCAIDCTAEVHPLVAERAVQAVAVVGLDIAGVDLVAEDIRRPLESQGGAIVEINAGPGLLAHLRPAIGTPQPVGEAIIAHLFPERDSARIPLVGVVGGPDTTVLSRLIAWILMLGGEPVGLACRDGLFLDRRQIARGSALNFEAGQRLLMNRTVAAVVIESDAAAILREGLPYDRSEVAVVTGVQGTRALAEFHLDGDAAAFEVLRTAVDVVLPGGAAVLNAEDAHALAMAGLCDGEVILYARQAQCPALLDHRSRGGRVVFLREGRVWLAEGSAERALDGLARLAPGDTGILEAGVILAAVCACIALRLAPELIAAGMETFESEHTAVVHGVPVLRTRNH